MHAVSSTVKHLFLIFFCLISLYPIWFILQSSLKTHQQYIQDPIGIPTEPSLASFELLFTSWPVLTWGLNSAIVAVASSLGATILGILASYALVYGRFRGSKLIFSGNLALMVVPPVILMVPVFLFMVRIGLINSLPSVIIFYIGLFLPFSIFFLTNFLQTVPYELIEAAKIDGLSPLATLRLIVAPLTLPALFTLTAVNIIYGWNELLIALVFLQDSASRTLMPGLALSQGRFSTNIPMVMAGAFVSVLPIILLYIFGQRYFVKGLTAGIGK